MRNMPKNPKKFPAEISPRLPKSTALGASTAARRSCSSCPSRCRSRWGSAAEASLSRCWGRAGVLGVALTRPPTYANTAAARAGETQVVFMFHFEKMGPGHIQTLLFFKVPLKKTVKMP